MDNRVRILIADRHPLYRGILREVVTGGRPATECLEAQTLDEVFALAAESPALLLVDLSLDNMDGLTGLLRLCMRLPQVPIVVVSATEAEDLTRCALICGAAACIAKSMNRAEMLAALRPLLQCPGTMPPRGSGERLDVLTARERMVLEALVRGSSNKRIAYELQVTDTTVKAHVSAILRKLGVHSRTQAVIKARWEDCPVI